MSTLVRRYFQYVRSKHEEYEYTKKDRSCAMYMIDNYLTYKMPRGLTTSLYANKWLLPSWASWYANEKQVRRIDCRTNNVDACYLWLRNREWQGNEDDHTWTSWMIRMYARKIRMGLLSQTTESSMNVIRIALVDADSRKSTRVLRPLHKRTY
jgi:hypothetical protein